MKFWNVKKNVAISAIASMALCFGGPSVAQDTITLKVADSFPSGHYIAKSLTEQFMNRVVELTNGKVEFEYYPAQQLGKIPDYIQLAQAGSIDIAYVVPALTSDKTPHIPVLELPGLFDDSCTGTKALVEMSSPGGAVADLDFAPNDVRFIMGVMNTPVTFLTSNKEVQSVEDVKGLKVRTPGGGQEKTVETLGAVSVKMGGAEMYQALSRKTVDALMIPLIAVKAYDLQDLINYAAIGPTFGSGINMYVINQAKFDSLPKDVQAAIVKAGKEASQNSCSVLSENETKARDELVAEGKLTLVEADEAQVAEWQVNLNEVASKWVETTDARDGTGTKLLEAAKQAIQ